MADFSISQIGGAPASPISPERGVAEPSGASAVAGLFSSAIQSFAQGSPQRAAEQKQKQEDYGNTVVGRFSVQQAQIADAVDRGDLSSQEARMRMRANYAAAIADNGALAGDITKAHKAVLSTAGLGKVAAEGTQQEQAFFKAQDGATKDGFITANMTQEQAREATYNWMEFNRAQQDIDAQQNQLALQRAQIGLQSDRVGLSTARVGNESAKLSLQQKKLQISSQQNLGKMANAYFPKLRTDFGQILDQLENGQIDEKEATRLLDGQWATFQAATSQVGSEAGSEYISNLSSPMKFMYENTRKRISGEIDNNILQQRNERAMAIQTNAMLEGDPEVAKIAALSKLLPQTDLLAQQGMDNVAIRILGKNQKEEGPPANLADTDDAKQASTYLNIVKSGMTWAMEGDADAETIKQTNTNINKILKGVDAYQNSVEEPQQYNKLVEFFSDPTFGDYMIAHGEGAITTSAQNAREVLMEQYEREAKVALQNKWEEAKVQTSTLGDSGVLGTSSSSTNATDLIQPTWSGNGLVFQATKRGNARIDAKVKELNSSVSPVVNRLIRMGAHFARNKDYKKVYEENYADLFGAKEENSE